MSAFQIEKNETTRDVASNGHDVNGHGSSVEDSDETDSFVKDDRKLVSKIDWHLLPWICLLYGLALIDRYKLQL